MIVVGCGGRHVQPSYDAQRRLAHYLAQAGCSILFHGDATGADQAWGNAAHFARIQVVKVPANWDGLGRSAGPRRNELVSQIVGRLWEPFECWALPGGRGTEHSCSLYQVVRRFDLGGIMIGA